MKLLRATRQLPPDGTDKREGLVLSDPAVRHTVAGSAVLPKRDTGSFARYAQRQLLRAGLHDTKV